MKLSDEFIEELKEHEGFAPHMYRDTAGHMTVGWGHLIPSIHAARKLPFRIRDTTPAPAGSTPEAAWSMLRTGSIGTARSIFATPTLVLPRVASPAEVDADWNNLMREPFGNHTKKYYARIAKVFLFVEDCETLFQADLEQKINEVRSTYGDFNKYPTSAQEAILDMAFNVGVAKLRVGFPKLHAAIRAMDWQTAAKQCNRYQLSKQRNQATRDRFLLAAERPAPHKCNLR